VVADAMRLQQVLVNLGGNAIKFTAQGQVVLRVRNLAQSGQDSELEFSIQDSGIGIAPEQQEHIFTGFSQAEASTTRRFGGTGLGLAISRRLVELMGGHLILQSAVGEGSTFSFRLRFPAADDVALATPEPQRFSVPPKRVLVVDDNPVARSVLAAMVRSWSWPIDLADSGAQALDFVRSNCLGDGPGLDVIYLDWQMPGMDGWETARQLRQLCQGLATQPRIVMLSANTQDSLQRRTAEEQALIDDFLFKPVTASALQDAALGRDSAALPSGPPARSSQRPLAGMRILVVEDNLINQQVAEELLGAEGALVSLAANGQLGVDAVATSTPSFDVVLMDIQMPVLDGFGATRKIREELGLKILPIVAMTANAMASDRLACLQAGMDEHVGKPFDMAHLVRTLLRVTGTPAGELAARPLALDGRALFSNAYLDVGPALERISGLTELYVDIGQEFLLALDAVEGDYRQAAQAAQISVLAAQMHTLKGTSATLGADLLSGQAAVLEKMFRLAAPGVDPAAQLPGLLDLIEKTRAAMVQALSSIQAEPQADAAQATVPATAAERDAAMEHLTRLAHWLAASNLAALDHFAQRGKVLDVLTQAQLASLQEALRGLDLNRARQLCEGYAAALAETPGEAA
jgi:CheY-like chemotaxis protein